MARLIIIRGNSGSGKSTLAKALQRKLGRNTMVISQDVVRREMLWVRDGAESPALPLLIHLLQYGREHSETVILEGILYAAYYQALFHAARAAYGEQIYAYYYDLPFEETLLRHQSRHSAFDFGEADMRRWWRERDLVGFLDETILTRTLSLDDAVSLVLNDIASGAGAANN